MKISLHVGLCCAVVLAVVAVGCRPDREASDAEPVLQLNWIPDAQHGGYFAAKSILQNRSPDPIGLTIRPGSPGTPGIPQLVLGQVDFVIANADQVLLAREQGADIVALFAPLQNSPRCIMVHEDANIQSLHQLQDLTLAMGEGKAFAEFLKAKTQWKNVRIVAYTGTVARFLSEKNFAQQAYSFSEPLVVRQRGGRARCLMVSELGFNPYTSVLVTRRGLLETAPELVQAVVRASRDGWRDYLRSPAAVHATLQQLNPDMDAEILDQSAQEIRALCLPNDMPLDQLGTMTPERWQLLADQLYELGLLKSDGMDVSRAYTTQYLQ